MSVNQKLHQAELRDEIAQQKYFLSRVLQEITSSATPPGVAGMVDDNASMQVPSSLVTWSPTACAIEEKEYMRGVEQRIYDAPSLGLALPKPLECKTDTATGFYVGAQQLATISCDLHCICVCHKERRMRTPQALNSFIGALFVSYSGLPMLMQGCNQPSCNARSRPLVYVNYVFPQWVLARMMSLVATMHPSGPIATIKVQRTVPSEAELFTFAKLGNIEGLVNLFKDGRASPNDVHYISGVTALHFAVAFQRISACKLLLQAGADPFLCSNKGGASAADKAWSRIFSNTLSPEGEREIRLMFSQAETMERRNFTTLHRIILGLCDKPLEEELRLSTAEVNARDCLGRTALSLAAEKGNTESVSLLLAAGAHPSTTANSGTTALCYAARTSDLTCVSLLIAAGAEVRSKTDWDQTALHYAAAHSTDRRNAQLLLEAGADANAVDRDGRTPLGFTPIPNHLEIAACLLEYGAHVRSIDETMIDPLSLSIETRRYQLVDLFITHGFDPTTPLPKSQTLLHIIAAFGDQKMMKLFQRVPFSCVDMNKANDDGFTALALLRRREDFSSALFSAFSYFISAEAPMGQETLDEMDVWEDAAEFW